MIKTVGQRTIGLLFMILLTMNGLFAVSQLSLAGAVVLSVASLPAFLVILAWGGVWFALYGAITMLLTGVLGSSALAFLLIPMVIVPVSALFSALKMGFSPMRSIAITLLISTVVSVGIWSVGVGLGQEWAGLKPFRQFFTDGYVWFEQQIDMVQEKKLETVENIDIARKNLKFILEHTMLLIPITLIFLWHLVSTGLIYYGAQKFTFHGCKIESLPPFASWRFDWQLVWLFIAGFVLYYGLGGIETLPFKDVVKMVGANCLAISKILYFIAGASLLFFMFDKYKIGSLSRVGLSCLALVLTQAVVWFGIIDVWADFRTPRPALFSTDDSEDDF